MPQIDVFKNSHLNPLFFIPPFLSLGRVSLKSQEWGRVKNEIAVYICSGVKKWCGRFESLRIVGVRAGKSRPARGVTLCTRKSECLSGGGARDKSSVFSALLCIAGRSFSLSVRASDTLLKSKEWWFLHPLKLRYIKQGEREREVPRTRYHPSSPASIFFTAHSKLKKKRSGVAEAKAMQPSASANSRNHIKIKRIRHILYSKLVANEFSRA